MNKLILMLGGISFCGMLNTAWAETGSKKCSEAFKAHDIELKSTQGTECIVPIGSVDANFVVDLELVPSNSLSKFGIILGDSTQNNSMFVGCDLTSDILCYSHWIKKTKDSQELITKDIAKFYKDYKRNLRIVGLNGALSIYVDGEKIAETDIDINHLKQQPLYLKAYDGGDITASHISVCNLSHTKQRKVVGKQLQLANPSLSVVFDNEFPTVVSYCLPSGKTVTGATHVTPYVLINGLPYPLKAKAIKHADEIVYNCEAIGADVSFVTTFRLDNQTLQMEVSHLKEPEDAPVRTFAFYKQDLVSLENQEAGAMLSLAKDVASDQFIALDTIATTARNRFASIAILNNAAYAATLDNNSLYNAHQAAYRTDGKRTFLSSNEWICRGHDGKPVPMPEMRIILTEDRNTDGKVDWQDAAGALADVIEQPYGADMVRSSYATITMNFASGAQYPFARQLDNIKRFYNATDGFGQMLELKGYQGEGHDSSHPDYAGNYNTRAGGLSDLQQLTQKAKAYNAAIGLHINQSEAYPEAKAYNGDIITDIPGWAWLDQAYLINKERDVISGSFENRLTQLKKDLPHLSFIYIDTYREHRYLAYNTAKLFNDNKWVVWTEDSDIFYRQSPWIHYVAEANSMISRFVLHTTRDGFNAHPLLMGGYSRSAEIGFMGWQKGRNFNQVIENFFTLQLPYRYLMHHKIKQINDNEVMFEQGVVSRKQGDQYIIEKNGKPVLIDQTVFIPWNPEKEDKIYHYNKNGGKTTWKLPDSWSTCKLVVLYKLDEQGRQNETTLSVHNAQVTIDADAACGYVLYKSKPAPLMAANWGEIGLVKNPAFDGGLQNWKATGDVQAAKTSYGQSIVTLSNGTLSQQIPTEKGTSYIASVWVQVNGSGKATLTVAGKETSVNESLTKNYTDNTDKYNTRYQRMLIPFVAEGNEQLTLTFKADNDTSTVEFDDVRLVATKHNPQIGEGIYFEDFENVDEGWGPFTAAKPSSYTTHLSNRNEGYTNDVLLGNWSLKTWREGNGEVYRTSPVIIQFDSNQRYHLAFVYQASKDNVYGVSVRSAKTGEELLAATLDGAGRFAQDFTTGNADDYYVVITKNGDGTFLLDNFMLVKQEEKQ